jgi:hypothetical protein
MTADWIHGGDRMRGWKLGCGSDGQDQDGQKAREAAGNLVHLGLLRRWDGDAGEVARVHPRLFGLNFFAVRRGF